MLCNEQRSAFGIVIKLVTLQIQLPFDYYFLFNLHFYK